jgi:hypothetical protein
MRENLRIQRGREREGEREEENKKGADVEENDSLSTTQTR